MKKYLFLLLSILSIFFITDRVEALSFTTPSGNTYEVVDDETFAAYCYYTLKNEDFIIATGNYSIYSNAYMCIYGPNLSFMTLDSTTLYNRYGYDRDIFTPTFSLLKSGQYISSNFSYNLIYSTFNIKDYNDNSVFAYSSNLTIDYLNNKYDSAKKPVYTITYYLNNEVYKQLEIEEGKSHELENYSYNSDFYNFSGWTVEDNKDLTNITSDIVIRATLEGKGVTPVYIKNINDFPIQKTEFYSLLVLLGTLIIMLFLKWCFPFKGGSDLK